MRTNRIRALTMAAAVVAWNGLVDPRLPARWQPLLRAALGGALVVIIQPGLGLRPPALRSGVRLGAAVASTVAAGVAATTAIPAVRAAMRQRQLPTAPAHWVLLRIPVGTVWPEEAVFRGALRHLAADAFGPAAGRMLQASAFGLSHIADARAAGAPIVGTVLVTGVAGWLFGWLAERSGSVAAPMLAHLAINEAGALAVLAAQRR
ncbi:abortive infection protein [Mycolicibacterium mageritense DSM 44476 = CIP 104973]|uniref:Abortive infection protein n=2 Tax=Mycolicibacterium TaxID=1866885 RepID=A0AAI8TR19_MYCME|nr:CPBP family intramembrane glutamic endopeptidase [Mycolicibacterium mageritense]MCC9182097.1 CPBP family intramembrane metalloprotease [Mycolicibacterium mageritense]TXI59129.1 MAG: CPBP family intramembrane metalloprotease [Mycolicibacterium mageritense]CDO23447.1 abortive infection protein [Mycolicibacterium mageritense DSM 44476 = CIP 104973]BBX32005.1 abortive infection protein [Mycolicibacterium mageritense]BDY27158.1 hypothetical protein hbim_01079 [Mycolicibacterium mageritense]